MKVDVIEENDKETLVEHEGRRVTVPTAAVRGSIISKETFEKGTPRGEAWEKVVALPTPKALAAMLHEAGLHTKAEALANLAKVRALLKTIELECIVALRDYCRRDE